MDTEVTKRVTPEEEELNKKLTVLSDLEIELAQSELDLATLQAELNTFEVIYLRKVGAKIAELDEIKARIAEAEARLNPKDERLHQRAHEARFQANNSAEATSINSGSEDVFKPPDSLKKLYRDVAKCIHPDLATEDTERARCQQLMAEANQAYEACDGARLQAILSEWESSPESVKGEGTAAELVRVIRKIAQAEKRILAIHDEMAKMRETDLYILKIRADEAQKKGRDLLEEMASQLSLDIKKSINQLNKIIRTQDE